MPVDPRAIHESAARGDWLFPGAYWRPLPENATQAARTPSQFIMHTQASGGKASNDASWRYWARDDIKSEAHFLLAMDPATEPLGGLWQCMSIFVQADNNVKANPTAVSIETQDLGGATVDTTPWTEYQLDTLAALLAWLHLNTRVNLVMQLCPAWNGPGYAPHNLFPNDWSTSKHSCPGRARTLQIPEVRRRADQIIAWTPPPPPEVIDPPIPSEEDVMLQVYISPPAQPADGKARAGAILTIDQKSKVRMSGVDTGTQETALVAVGLERRSVSAADYDALLALSQRDASA